MRKFCLQKIFFIFKKIFSFNPYIIVLYEINNLKFNKYFNNWEIAMDFYKDCSSNNDIKNISIKII